MIGHHRWACAGLLALVLAAGTAGAQPAPSGGSIELAMDVSWSGPVSFSTGDALEVDRTGGAYRLFASDASVRGALGYGVRAAFPLNERWQVEASASYARPELAVHVSDDVEGAASATIGETLHRIQLDGGVLLRLGSLLPEKRNQPFLTAGAGYLRELHEGQTLASNGQLGFVGAGVRRVLKIRPDARITTIGLRVQALLQVRSGGVNLDDHIHVLPVVAGSLFLKF